MERQLSLSPLVGRWLVEAAFVRSGPSKAASYGPTAQGRRVQRVAAQVLFVLMTAVFFHARFSDQGQAIHILKNLTISGGLLQIVYFGAGAGPALSCRRVRARRA